MIRVTVDSIRVSLLTQQRIVLLQDKENRRYLPIYIDPFMAEHIARAMQGEAPPRPMTHDLLKNVIEALGGSVEYVLIAQLQDAAYHATLVITTRNGRREIDARSSDAIALALRVDVPIYADEAVLDQAGQSMDDEAEADDDDDDDNDRLLPPPGRTGTRNERSQSFSPVREETEDREVDEESLSVFREFINSLEKPKPPEEGS